jgi:hypothetical protein
MVKISQVLIAPEALDYLVKRQLDKQYQKAKIFIIAWHFANLDLKIREPKEDRIWYFRINKQHRALCELDGETLYVLAIDNHQ